VRVKATGICGSDIPRVLHHGAHGYPVVLGHEFSGEVMECGEGVTTVKPGDRVAGAPLLPCMACADCQTGNYALCKNYSFIGSRQQGSFAEFVALPEWNCVKFGNDVSFEMGALFEPSTVALHGLLLNGFHGGGSVAVLGCGTIGIFALQWARILGARSITAFDVSPERLELARRLGADDAVNTSGPGFTGEAMRLTGGRGYADVFETAGSPETMRMAYELAGNKSRVCFVGTPHTDLTFTPKLWENMNRKEFLLTGSWMSYSAPFPGREWEMTAHYFGTGALKADESMIFKRLPLKQIAEGFDMYRTPGLVKGKIMITVD
jgi:L-iditol 2-dehydrogenase